MPPPAIAPTYKDPLAQYFASMAETPADPIYKDPLAQYFASMAETPEEIARRAQIQKTTQENLEKRGEFARGVSRGTDTLQASLYGFAGLAGSALGMEGVKEWGFEGYKRNLEEAQQNPASVKFDDLTLTEPMKAARWAWGTLGELAPSMAEALVTSLAGAAIGTAAAPGPGTATGALAGFLGKRAMRKMVEEASESYVKKGVAREAAEAFAAKEVASIAESALVKAGMRTAGAQAGIVAGVMPLESGGNWGETLQEKGIDNPTSALATGTVAAFLELAGGNSRLIGRVLGPAKETAFRKAVSLGDTKLVARTAKEALISGGGEYAQEFGQEFLSLVNTAGNDPTFEIYTTENLKRLNEAGWTGFVGGAAGGAAGGAKASITDKTAAKEKTDLYKKLADSAKLTDPILTWKKEGKPLEDIYNNVAGVIEEFNANLPEKMRKEVPTSAISELVDGVLASEEEAAKPQKRNRILIAFGMKQKSAPGGMTTGSQGVSDIGSPAGTTAEATPEETTLSGTTVSAAGPPASASGEAALLPQPGDLKTVTRRALFPGATPRGQISTQRALPMGATTTGVDDLGEGVQEPRIKLERDLLSPVTSETIGADQTLQNRVQTTWQQEQALRDQEATRQKTQGNLFWDKTKLTPEGYQDHLIGVDKGIKDLRKKLQPLGPKDPDRKSVEKQIKQLVNLQRDATAAWDLWKQDNPDQHVQYQDRQETLKHLTPGDLVRLDSVDSKTPLNVARVTRVLSNGVMTAETGDRVFPKAIIQPVEETLEDKKKHLEILTVKQKTNAERDKKQKELETVGKWLAKNSAKKNTPMYQANEAKRDQLVKDLNLSPVAAAPEGGSQAVISETSLTPTPPSAPAPPSGAVPPRPEGPSISNVFSRMPDDVLRQQAELGGQGAKDEMVMRTSGGPPTITAAGTNRPIVPPRAPEEKIIPYSETAAAAVPEGAPVPPAAALGSTSETTPVPETAPSPAAPATQGTKTLGAKATVADRYLNEQINYGGEIRSRGSVIAEMQDQGIPRPQIDAYMMGAKPIVKEAVAPNTEKGIELYSVESKKEKHPALKPAVINDLVGEMVGAVKGIEARQAKDGAWVIKTKNGRAVEIEAVEQITPTEIEIRALERDYGVKFDTARQEGKRIAGAYTTQGDRRKIRLVKNAAGLYTATHEFEHFLEDIGAVSKADVLVLQQKIRNLHAQGKLGFKPANADLVGGPEDRAKWVARQITGVYDAKTVTGKIIQKIKEIIDRIVNALGSRTAGGVVRDIREGKVFEKESGSMKNVPGKVHEYSSTQLNLPDSDADLVRDFAAKIPNDEIFEDPKDPSFGREENPHITVKYGLHTANAKDVENVLSSAKAVTVTLGPVSIFKSDTYDVVKIDVTGDDLVKLNKSISDGIEHTDTQKGYKPHITIAYVKKGEGEKYVGDKTFEGKKIIFNDLVFSGKDGDEASFKLKTQDIARTVPDKVSKNRGLPGTRRYANQFSMTKKPGTANIPPETTPKAVGGKLYFHGTDREFAGLDFRERKAQGIFGQPASKSKVIYLAENAKDANFFASWRGKGEPRIIEAALSPDAKILDLSFEQGNKGYLVSLEILRGIDKDAADSIDETNSTVQQELENSDLVDKLKNNGYDGVRFDEAEGHGISVGIFNTGVILPTPSRPPEVGGQDQFSLEDLPGDTAESIRKTAESLPPETKAQTAVAGIPAATEKEEAKPAPGTETAAGGENRRGARPTGPSGPIGRQAEEAWQSAFGTATAAVHRGLASLGAGRVSPETRASLSRFKQHWQEFWSPFSTVPEGKQALVARYKAMGDVAKAMRFLEELHAKLDTLPDDVKKDMFRYLDGQIPLEVLPAGETRRLAEQIRQRTRTIGLAMVERGILKQEQFDAYDGRYIHYMYAYHVLGDDAKTGSIVVGNNGKLNLTETMRRNPNLTMEQRKALGLIEDASIAVPVGMGKALTDIAKWDYLQAISQNADWVWQPSFVELPLGKPKKDGTQRMIKMTIGKLADETSTYARMVKEHPSPEVEAHYNILKDAFEKAQEETKNVPEDFEQLSDSKHYGPLAGAFVRKPIAADLKPVLGQIDQDTGKLARLFWEVEQQSVAIFKMGKVALNVPTGFRNIFSNIIQMNMRGRALPNVIGDIIRALESYKAKDSFYEEAYGMGLFHSNWFTEEVGAIMDEFKKAQSGNLFKVMQAVKNVAKYYGRIDDFSKLAIFRQMRESGADVGESAVEAMKWGMDYSLASRSVKGFRRHIIPFGTYQYKIAGLITESLAKRPWVIAKYMALPAIARAVAMGMNDLDDDDWDKLEKQLPVYIKKSGSVIIMPWKTDKGQWQWVNTEYFMPFGNWMNMFRDAVRGDVGEFLQDMGISHPLVDLFYTYRTARDGQPPVSPWMGKTLYNDLDHPAMKAAKVLEHIAFTFLPTMLSPSFGALGQTWRAAVGGEDRWGREVSIPMAVGRWFGINVTTVSPEQTAAIASVRLSEMHKELARIKADPRNSEEEKAAAEARMREKIAAIAEKTPDAVMPISKQKGEDPVYNALVEMVRAGSLKSAPPSRTVEIGGISHKMSIEQYRGYLEKSSEIAHPRLQRLFESDGWKTMNDKRKGEVVSAVITNARKGARQRIKVEISKEIKAKKVGETAAGSGKPTATANLGAAFGLVPSRATIEPATQEGEG